MSKTVINTNLFSCGKCYISQTYAEHIIAVSKGGYAQGIDLVSCNTSGNYIESNVLAYANGTVFFAGVGSGYGNAVWILHSDGTMSGYGHMKSLAVTQGQKVNKGTVLGVIGTSGNSTGIHLHFEIRKYTNSTYDKNPTPAKFWNPDSFMTKSYYTWIDPTSHLNSAIQDVGAIVTLNGYLDSASYPNGVLNVTGWAYKGGTPQNVDIYVDGVKVGSVATSVVRNDVQSAISANTNVLGYSFTLRKAFTVGKHTVIAKVGSIELKLNPTPRNTFTIALTATSYPNYTDGKVYRVRKSYDDSISAIGSWSNFASAFRAWEANKSRGYNIYAWGNKTKLNP